MEQRVLSYDYTEQENKKDSLSIKMSFRGWAQIQRSHLIKRIVLIGAGSSNVACYIAKELCAQFNQIEVVVAESYHIGQIFYLIESSETAFLAVSHSGKNRATLQAIRTLQNQGAFVTGVTPNIVSPVARACNEHLNSVSADETVGSKKVGMTSIVLTLYLIMLEYSLACGNIDKGYYDKLIKDLPCSF